MDMQSVSGNTMKRLPIYLSYLKSLPDRGITNVSSTMIAKAIGLNDVQVRKDLAAVSSGGRPKVGYVTESLISDIKRFLGYDISDVAVIVGAGNLGRALMSYRGFSEYGLEISAAFDVNESLIGTTVDGKPIMPLDRMEEYCKMHGVKIGIIAVPAEYAQELCDKLVSCGILAVWNFAPTHLKVADGVLVQNENMACSLALLSKHLNEKLMEKNSNRI